ncbi:MAG: YdcF family protein [Bacteroidetes bacterium]|nr:YdcF family protein [Bacteroidota bacterium]
MFFILSKILGVLLKPLFWILVLLLWAWITKNVKRRKILLIISFFILFFSSNKVLVNELAIAWESDKNNVEIFPKTAVVLGGFANYDSYRSGVTLTEAAERIYAAMELYRKHFIDTIIISGGAASITGKIKPESIYVRRYLIQQGIDSNRIWIDTVSKNTWENAVESKKILEQLKCNKILLITSAFHMPRAMQTFKKAGINPVPYNVQFYSNPNRGYIFSDYILPSSEALNRMDAFVKEWVGYLVYKISGKA